LAENNINTIIGNTKQLIYGIEEKLLQDNWEECKEIIYRIIDNLSDLLNKITESHSNEYLEVQNSMLPVIDSVLKAVSFEDTIQLADLLLYDMMSLFGEIQKNN